MGRRGVIRYAVTGLVFFLFASGFLGFCTDKNYKPCTIEFTSPVNGTVFPTGTSSVMIQGKVVAGDKAPLLLFVLDENGANLGQVSFDQTTGEFSYTGTLNSTTQYTTFTFEIKDANFIANKERISFAVGDSLEPGADGVVDNAARLMLTDDFMDQVEVIGADFINNWKNDLIYGTSDPQSPFYGSTPLLPLSVNLGSGLGTLEINPSFTGNYKGYVNLGTVSMAIDIKPGGVISANLSIAAATGVNPRGTGNKAIFVQGRHWATLLGNPHFTLMANAVNITNAKLRLSVNAENKITASLDLSDADLSLSGVTAEYGILDFPSWILDWIIGLVKDEILGMLALDIPIIDANNIVLPPIMGIQAGGWPMNTSTIFTSTENDMTVDLGISAVLADGYTPLIEGLTKFYATPGDELPTLAIPSGATENIQIALTDDIVNNLAFVAIQAGLVNEMDVTAQFQTLLSTLSLDDLKATVTLDTPPILDFSGEALDDTLAIYDMGRVIIRNLKINIYFNTLLRPIAMRLSVDVNAALQLDISDDGKKIVGGIDTTQSKSTITICYDNIGNAAFAPTIGKEIANYVVDLALRSILNIDLTKPLELYGLSMNLALIGTELNNNALVAKASITSN